jgi:arylsulfatase
MQTSKVRLKKSLGLCGATLVWLTVAAPVLAQQKPNIVVIMGDDIGMWNIGAYHRGMMAGTTPTIDQLAAEGAIFTDYYAEASCMAGRAATGSATMGGSACRFRFCS